MLSSEASCCTRGRLNFSTLCRTVSAMLDIRSGMRSKRRFSMVGLLFPEKRRSISATVGRFCKKSRRSLSKALADT